MIKAMWCGLAIASALCAQETHQVIVQANGPNIQTFQFVGGQLLGGKPVKGMPYSAESVTQTTQTLADGSHIVNSTTSMLYRDSEGRERREESIGKLGSWSAQGQPAKAIFISDPVANVSYSLDTTAHTARKTALQSGPGLFTRATAREGLIAPAPGIVAGGARLSPGDNGPAVFYSASISGGNETTPKMEHLGTSTIEGIQAEGTRTTMTIPAGQIGNERDINIVSERWYSPELQVVVKSTHSDPRMGETIYKLTGINRSEPLPSMFQVPADYTISEPSQTKWLQPDLPKKDNDQ